LIVVQAFEAPETPKERAEQLVLLQVEPTEAFEWFRVERGVGDERNQGPSLIEPLANTS